MKIGTDRICSAAQGGRESVRDGSIDELKKENKKAATMFRDWIKLRPRFGAMNSIAIECCAEVGISK
ncbi:hypothetical protein [Caballeronia sp. GAWG1-1]|uniref:hypothetical protein n=1 Tax=Caballeronia sp. GAWG1-1 TaxID=2921742 RepID=UPI0020288CE2|nr:hypothetical protein [Caballeronia sp. GAWG1-1]